MQEVDVEVSIPIDAFLPCYQSLVPDPVPIIDIDIDLLFGGRDSGKSRFVASVLVLECMRQKYFRCVLARKTFNTIKDSQWQTIKDVVEAWGLDDLFIFTTAPLEIRCVNGNRFISRGFDEPGKIKSLSNVSVAWVEEGNQLDSDDFIILMSTLRTNIGKVKVWITYNPEADGNYEDFWLYKNFYTGYNGNIYAQFTHKWAIDIPASTQVLPSGLTSVSPAEVFEFTYRSTHTTYHDNPYCSPVRKAFLEKLKDLDPYFYLVFTLGKWGNRSVGDPYCFTFDESKHVGVCEPYATLPLYLSFDFNVNPITCGVYQHWEDENGQHIRGLHSIKLANSDIYALCDTIEAYYPAMPMGPYQYIITGDATGQNTTALVKGGIDYYTVIQAQLNLADPQIQVPSVNPVVKENRMLVNAAFKMVDVQFHPVLAKDLIFDCKYVSVDEMGKIDKGDRSNPKKRADHLDHFRYYLNSFHKSILKILS